MLTKLIAIIAIQLCVVTSQQTIDPPIQNGLSDEGKLTQEEKSVLEAWRDFKKNDGLKKTDKTQQSPEHSISADIGCIRATYKDLFDVIEKIRSVTGDANKGKPFGRESLTLEANAKKVDFNDNFSIDMLDSAPRFATRVYYSYRNYDAPISKVEIDLYDYSRGFTVAGTSPIHVDTLHNTLMQNLSNRSVLLGGSGFRLLIDLILFVFGYAMVVMGFNTKNRLLKCFLLTTVPFIGLFAALSHTTLMFQGTVIFQDSPSFIERESAAISAFGVAATVILGIGSIVYAGYIDYRSKRSNVSNENL